MWLCIFTLMSFGIFSTSGLVVVLIPAFVIEGPAGGAAMMGGTKEGGMVSPGTALVDTAAAILAICS